MIGQNWLGPHPYGLVVGLEQIGIVLYYLGPCYVQAFMEHLFHVFA